MWTFPSDFFLYNAATKMNLTQYIWRLTEDQVTVSSEKSISSIHPLYITGFTDAEGSFSLSISASSKYSTGFLVKLLFDIGLDKRDRELLEIIQSYFGVGKIYERGKSVIDYRVQSVEELEVIINHFDSYPLITDKWADYQLFKMAFYILKSKEHLTTEGINKLLSIKASMNKGLSEVQKAAFSTSVIPVERPKLIDQVISDPHWIVGFVDGEGCFFVYIQKSKVLIGEAVRLKFQITQHVRDLSLIRSLENTFGCGRVEISRSWACYVVTTFSDNLNKIIPFFDKYPLQGVKRKNFDDFNRVVSLVKNNKHLSKCGLEEIKQIKMGMNKGRKYDIN